MALGKLFPKFSNGFRMPKGEDLQNLSDALGSFQNPITAFAGGGQTSATPITAVNAVVVTVGSAADSVKLPPSYPGLEICVLNSHATNAIQVFGNGSDQVQTSGTTYAAAATGVSLAALSCAWYRCVKAGFWQRSAAA